MKKKIFMSKILSFATILSMVFSMTLGGLGLKTVEAVVPSNPELSGSCGLDIALVLDSSGSVDNSELSVMKDAFGSFVSILSGTPAQFSVVDFDSTATVNQAFTNDVTLVTSAINTATSGGATNWQDALIKAGSTFDPRSGVPNLVVFASDGNPTVNNDPNTYDRWGRLLPGSGSYSGSTTDGNDLINAVTEANTIKASGTRIITLGIGDGLNPDNLIAISSSDAYYDVSNFSELASTLQGLATELCGGTMTVTKIIDTDNNIQTTGDQISGVNWTFNVAGEELVTDKYGQTKSKEVNGGTYSISEIEKDGYRLASAFCSGATNNGTYNFDNRAIERIVVGDEDIVSCTFYNHQLQAPVITLVGSNPVNLTAGDAYVDEGATASDLEEGDLTSKIVVGGDAIDESTLPGTYTITYNVTDGDGLPAPEVTRTVIVAEKPAENQAPVITLVGSNPVNLTAGDAYVDEGATASDPEDGNLTGSIVTVNPVNTSTPGTYTVTYNVTDSKGLAATEVTRTVIVAEKPAENQPPVITLVGSNPVNLTAGDTYVDEGATASDPEDGNLTGSIVTVNPVNTSTPGTYTVTYNVTDSKGLSATEVTRTVIVNRAPVEDMCKNLEGTQETVPQGYTRDDEGNCFEIQEPVDVCLNIPEVQTEVPIGYHQEDGKYCFPNKVETYTLTYTAGTHGTISGDASQAVQEGNDGTKVTAVPDSGYKFVKWSDGVTTASRTDLDVKNDINVTATFTRKTSGGGGGSYVGSTPECSDGIDNDKDGLSDINDPGCYTDGNVNNPNSYNRLDNDEANGQVLGAEATCGIYVDKYVRRGYKNDVTTVKKIQTFLNDYMTSGLVVDGIFGPKTEAALKAFQTKHADKILTPWKLTAPTGIFYLTTQTEVNNIMCPDLKLPIPSNLIPFDQNPLVPKM